MNYLLDGRQIIKVKKKKKQHLMSKLKYLLTNPEWAVLGGIRVSKSFLCDGEPFKVQEDPVPRHEFSQF